MLTCQQVTRLLSAAQDRKLSWREKAPLKLHLLMCPGCDHFRQQMAFLRQAAREYAQGRPAAGQSLSGDPSGHE